MILTLGFDSASFARLEPLRQRHFPPARNAIPVHVTLFQQLPEARQNTLVGRLAGVAGRTPPLPFASFGVEDYGNGVGVALGAPGATALHSVLLDTFDDLLTESDRRPRALHVTLQNKVARPVAEATRAEIEAGLAPFEGRFDRLLLWHYRGLPWELAATFPLTGDSR